MTADSPVAPTSVQPPEHFPPLALYVRTRHRPGDSREPAPIRIATSAPLVRELADLTPEDLATFGQEAVDLGALKAAGLQVQDGFVLSTSAYSESMTAAGVDRELAELDAEAPRSVDPVGVCVRMTRLVRTAGPSDAVVAAVRKVYPGLGIEGFGPATVAVWPSRIGKDPGTDGSAAAVVVRGAPALLRAIVDCWASAFSFAGIARRVARGVGAPATAVIVQATAREGRPVG